MIIWRDGIWQSIDRRDNQFVIKSVLTKKLYKLFWLRAKWDQKFISNQEISKLITNWFWNTNQNITQNTTQNITQIKFNLVLIYGKLIVSYIKLIINKLSET